MLSNLNRLGTTLNERKASRVNRLAFYFILSNPSINSDVVAKIVIKQLFATSYQVKTGYYPWAGLPWCRFYVRKQFRSHVCGCCKVLKKANWENSAGCYFAGGSVFNPTYCSRLHNQLFEKYFPNICSNIVMDYYRLFSVFRTREVQILINLKTKFKDNFSY